MFETRMIRRLLEVGAGPVGAALDDADGDVPSFSSMMSVLRTRT